MEKKITAMMQFILRVNEFEYTLPLELQVKALECLTIEKEQIKDAWLSGQDDGATICTPNQQYPDEDYYNETYGKTNI